MTSTQTYIEPGTSSTPSSTPRGALGNTDVSCFRPDADGVSGDARESLRRQYRLQRWSAALLPGWRVEMCGMRAVEGSAVHITRNSEGRHGVSNVRRCGSGWVCPVCAPKIAAGRADEISDGVAQHHAKGGSVVLLTLTVQHHAGDGLADLITTLAAAQRRLWSGRWAQAFNRTWGVIGQIRNTEVTYGAATGWHPHSHVLLFTRSLSDAAARELVGVLKRRWADVVAGVGWYASPVHGLQGERVLTREERVTRAEGRLRDDALAQYFAEFGRVARTSSEALRSAAEELVGGDWSEAQELTYAHIKRARGVRFTPWALLEAAGGAGAERAPALWQEFADATKGRVLLRWSKGLRTRLKVGEAESDVELAEKGAADTQVVAEVSMWAWRQLVREELAAPLLVALDGYRGNGEEDVQGWINAWIRGVLAGLERNRRRYESS